MINWGQSKIDKLTKNQVSQLDNYPIPRKRHFICRNFLLWFRFETRLSANVTRWVILWINNNQNKFRTITATRMFWRVIVRVIQTKNTVVWVDNILVGTGIMTFSCWGFCCFERKWVEIKRAKLSTFAR